MAVSLVKIKSNSAGSRTARQDYEASYLCPGEEASMLSEAGRGRKVS